MKADPIAIRCNICGKDMFLAVKPDGRWQLQCCCGQTKRPNKCRSCAINMPFAGTAALNFRRRLRPVPEHMAVVGYLVAGIFTLAATVGLLWFLRLPALAESLKY